MIKAVYAISGDPITYGHINIVERTSKTYDEVHLVIGDNPEKNYLFTKEERVEMAKVSLSHLKNVKVDSFEGLLIDYANDNNISIMIRGIRNTKDMEYEYNLYQVNDSQEMEIETVCLFTKPELSKVSSSNVKAIQKENGLTKKYVPLVVKDKLEQKISKQKVIGITGVMGSGKSFSASYLKEYSKDKDVKVHNLELDDIAKFILYESKKPSHLKIQEQLFNKFKTLDKKEIAEKLFSKVEYIEFMKNLITKPSYIELRQRMKNLEGIILINNAVLVEYEMLDFVNNNVILVHIDNETRFEYLKEKRYISEKDAKNRIKYVLSTKEKKAVIKEKINKENYGNIFEVINNKEIKTTLEYLYKKLSSSLN